jgi:nitronate monooxygenase
MFDLAELRVPLVVAPMAGGPSTPALAAAVAGTGGLGYLAAGNLPVQRMIGQVEQLWALGAEEFGVNVFVPAAANTAEDGVDPSAPDRSAAVARYRLLLAGEAERYGIELPDADPADTDDWEAKIAYLLEHPVPVVSFTFGLPRRPVIDALHGVGSHVTITVTDAAEAAAATESGADSLAVQGPEAGGHRGTHTVAKRPSDLELDALLGVVAEISDLPRIAAGGVASAARVRELLGAGASAVQLGTAFLRTPESGASDLHKDALASGRHPRTVVTRAFTGRFARGLENRFIIDHDAEAVAAYPEINLTTRAIRAAALAAGDPEALSLWAGTAYADARNSPAAEVVASLWRG